MDGDRDAADVLFGANLTAHASVDVNDTPYLIWIRNLATGAVEAACASGSECSTSVRSSSAESMDYEAWVGYYDDGPTDVQGTVSDPWSIDWQVSESVSLWAYKPVAVTDEFNWVSATVGVDVSGSPFAIYLRNDTTGELTSCSDGDTCDAFFYSNTTGVASYSAWVGHLVAGEPDDVQAESTGALTVTTVSGEPGFNDTFDYVERCSGESPNGYSLCVNNGGTTVTANRGDNSTGAPAENQEPDPDTDEQSDACFDFNRESYCTSFVNHLVVLFDGEVTGSADYTVQVAADLDPTQTTYTVHVKFIFDRVDGDADAATLQATTFCVAHCTSNGSGINSTGLYEGKVVEKDFQITADTMSRGDIVAHRTGLLSYFLLISGSTTEVSAPDIVQYQPGIRCDNALPEINTFAGCIVGNTTPTIKYSLNGAYPELASHIDQAQASGLPGSSLTEGIKPLRRAPGYLSDRSRRIACPTSGARAYPRPDGKSCDEYPFASSFQGALFSNGGPRTFAGCEITLPGPPSTGSSGYSVCMIDETQNSSGGSQLNNQFKENRVLVFDEYFVNIVFGYDGP